jgi:uncharacterized DUF497 family protein
VWFEWDAIKAAANRHKHGVSFEAAVRVFDDPRVLSVLDRRYSEERWYSLGAVGEAIIYVAHTIENQEQTSETIRIISARQASARERQEYQTNAATAFGVGDGESPGQRD